MRVEDIRHIVGMSQREFSDYFGIPIGTLRNWEQGISKPPIYVFQMILQSVRRDKMINLETIKFMKMLDELACLSENGIESFTNATQENISQKIFYDEESKDEKGNYMVVSSAVVIDDPECIHHDILSYYKSKNNDYRVRVRLYEEENEPYVIIELSLSEEVIIVEKGMWYFA